MSTTAAAPRVRWYHKALAVLTAVLIMEIGLFLVIYPWTDYWDDSWFSYLSPAWDRLWMSPYFRGGVTGLGLVNIAIACSEIIGLRRFAAPLPAEDEEAED
jgi:hypothetical protein